MMMHVSNWQGCSSLDGICGTAMMLETDQPSQLLPTTSTQCRTLARMHQQSDTSIW